MSTNILIFNCGSSSLNYKIFKSDGSDTLSVLAYGTAHRVGVKGSEASFIEHHALGSSEQQVVTISMGVNTFKKQP
jgi:acetate kinase